MLSEAPEVGRVGLAFLVARDPDGAWPSHEVWLLLTPPLPHYLTVPS